MFAAILRTQWKWTRAASLIGFIAGFAIPLMSLLSLQGASIGFSASALVRTMQSFGVLYALLSAASGLACAMLAWGHDHRGRHVYALSLPVTRTRYTSMRFAAGAICLMAPVAGVLLGCLVGLAASKIPAGLHAYPFALTLRFLLACFVSYSLFFAILASSTKASAITLGAVASVIIAVFVMLSLNIGEHFVFSLADGLFGDHGLLSVFTGHWMLIDV